MLVGLTPSLKPDLYLDREDKVQPPPVTADQLRQFVERQHGGKAELVTKLTVRQFDGRAALAEVYIFDLRGNAKSTRAYAWTAWIADTGRCEFHTRLHLGAVQSPVDAVRAWAEQSASQ